MKLLSKIELEAMVLPELEIHKQKLFNSVIKGKGAKRMRNALYELLGVIECKRKYSADFLELELA